MEDFVDSCPQNITAVLESSTRLGCGQDKYGNDQYICVPNIEKTGLIELCYNGIMGIIERGNCLRTTGGQLYRTSCLGFSSGCPEEEYKSNKIYKYPSCQSINKQHGCYFAESSCPNGTEDITTRDTTEISTLGLSTNLSIYNTTMSLQESTLPQDEDNYTAVIVGSVIAFVFIVVLLGLAIILWKKKCRKKKRKQKREYPSEAEGDSFLPENGIETADLDNVLEQDNTPLQCLGENEFSAMPSYEHPSPSTKDKNVDGTVKAQEQGVNIGQEERVHDVTEPGVIHSNTEAESTSRTIPTSITYDEGTLEKQETGVNSDPKEREYGVTEVTEAGSNDSSSEMGSILSWRTSSDYYKEVCAIDLLSELTKDQYAVLYTLLLCCDIYGYITVEDDVSMGDIDVRKTEKELKDRGLVKRDSNQLLIPYDKRFQIMRSYSVNCLLSDIDIDFFIQVTSGFSLNLYTEVCIPNQYVSRRLQDKCPITLMRLIVEAQTGEIRSHFHRLRAGPNILPPSIELGDISRKLRDVILRWCWLKKIVDNIALADNFPNEGIKSFYSAGTICPLDNKEIEGLFLTPLKSSILCTILMSENYKVCSNTLKEKNQEFMNVFPALQHAEFDTISATIDEMEKNDKTITLEKENNVIGFSSENVRHQVMSYFVMECLRTDEDYKKYIRLSSVDSLLEYARTWWYQKGENERCLFLPNKMDSAFVKRLGLDAIRHVMVEKRGYIDSDDTAKIRKKVTSNVNVPEEILDWDYNARCRYVQCAKKGTQTIHRARAMLLGCAGAGKTTLLKRLQKKPLVELRDVSFTVGLEVHEDIFEVLQDQDSLRALTEETNKERKKILSVMDFGGQCAYYACHQVYLSRRAFYLLVIDMSKSFKKKVDKKLCDQEGTMFCDWTYGEYLLFWMKSIHVYSAEDAPVILVGTHFDKTTGQTPDNFYNSILDQLRYDNELKAHLDRKRCFTIGIQTKDSSQFLDNIRDLEKCIVSIAKEDRWRDSIPTEWAFCEATLRELKSTNRLISLDEISREYFSRILPNDTIVQDVLKFFHDIGIILHFNEKSLSETIILDIQWFVDAFKNIITDPNHVKDQAKDQKEWRDFDQTGYLPENLLQRIWASMKFDTASCDNDILQYMERLGLIAVTLGLGRYMYIPCMNKRTFDDAHEEKLRKCQNKTSVIVFRFPLLPWFVYFRLIVACMTRTDGKWRVLNDDGLCLFKNIACFEFENHIVAIAVKDSSIQLQVLQYGKSFVIKEVALEVRDTIERLLNELTGSFHKKIMYTVGYQCSMNEVFREYDKCFVEEKEIQGKGQIICPRHEFVHRHTLFEHDLLGYWIQDCDISKTITSRPIHGDNFIILYEDGLRKFHFKMFEKLTKVGRNALQIYFDTVFPQQDLVNMLSRKDKLTKDYKLDENQSARLFPTDKSIPCSESFDVTMMYRMLRNRYPCLSSPTKGWGKFPETCATSKTDDVERIRIYRNEVMHEPEATSKLDKKDLEEKGRDLTEAILRLSKGKLQQEIINAMKNAT